MLGVYPPTRPLRAICTVLLDPRDPLLHSERAQGFAADPVYVKSEVFAYVGLSQNLKDLKDLKATSPCPPEFSGGYMTGASDSHDQSTLVVYVYSVPWSELSIISSYPHYPHLGHVIGEKICRVYGNRSHGAIPEGTGGCSEQLGWEHRVSRMHPKDRS